jgi:hypothetical protein
MASRASLSTAEVVRATAAAAKSGLRLVAVERKPDGTVRWEFGDSQPDNDDFWDGSPLYEGRGA